MTDFGYTSQNPITCKCSGTQTPSPCKNGQVLDPTTCTCINQLFAAGNQSTYSSVKDKSLEHECDSSPNAPGLNCFYKTTYVTAYTTALAASKTSAEQISNFQPQDWLNRSSRLNSRYLQVAPPQTQGEPVLSIPELKDQADSCLIYADAPQNKICVRCKMELVTITRNLIGEYDSTAMICKQFGVQPTSGTAPSYPYTGKVYTYDTTKYAYVESTTTTTTTTSSKVQLYCIMPTNFEVYQDMVRTFTTKGVACSSVDHKSFYPWPPSYPAPYGYYDETGTTSSYGKYYNMTYYSPSTQDKIAEDAAQIVVVPTTFPGDFTCKLSLFDTAVNGYSDFMLTPFTYDQRLNYTTGYIDELCFFGPQFVTKYQGTPSCKSYKLSKAAKIVLNADEQLILAQSIGCEKCFQDFYPLIVKNDTLGIFTQDCIAFPSNYGTVVDVPCTSPLQIYQKVGYTEDTKTVQCVTCSTLIPNCVVCGPNSTCTMCKSLYRHNFLLDAKGVGHSVCLYKYCGIKGKSPQCDVACKLDGCQRCEQIAALNFAESCVTCKPGYYPVSTLTPSSTKTQGKPGDPPIITYQWDAVTTCYPQAGVMQYDVFIKSTDQLLFTDDETKSIQANSGINMLTPYYFLANLLNDVTTDQQFKTTQQSQTVADVPDNISNTALPINLFRYASVTINVWLFKGVHHFFKCEKESPRPPSMAGLLTSLCSINRNSYEIPRSDNIIFNFKPMYCSERYNYFSQMDRYGSAYVFDQNCVDLSKDPKPQIRLASEYAHFNITNTMTFENIEFTGQDLLYISNSDYFTPSNYAQQKCEINSVPDGRLMALDIKNVLTLTGIVDATCVQPIYNLTAAEPTAQVDNRCWPDTYGKYRSRRGCMGDTYSKDFFTQFGQNFQYRHKTLFNLYSFDAMRSNRRHTPSLNFTSCEFRYFLSNMTSLVQVETNNFGMGGYESSYSGITVSDAVFPFYFGEDRGARIAIKNSVFEHSKFCKGLIVYSKTEPMDWANNMLLVNITANQNTTLDSSVDRKPSFLLISNSTFINLAFQDVLSHIGLLQYTTVNDGFLFETGNESRIFKGVKWPVFFHQGLVLNFQGFNGTIEIRDSTFQRNMVYIQETYITRYQPYTYQWPSLNDIQFSNFCSVRKEELALKWCDLTYRGTYFLNEFLNPNSEFDDQQLSSILETNSVITIRYPLKPVIIVNNKFSNNIGTFGIVNIYTPVFGSNPAKPAIILKNNVFKQNMSYFAGNAFYISLTMQMKYAGIDVTQTCGSQILIESNTFSNNIGMKRHNGGAGVLHCSLFSSTTTTLAYSNGNYIKPIDLDRKSQTAAEYLNVTYTDINDVYYGGPYDDPTTKMTKLNSTLVPLEQYQVLTYGTLIQNNLFSGNMAGMRGTALFISNINELQVLSNDIMYNGPLSVFQEVYYSPYYKYMAKEKKTIIYFDYEKQKCFSEFDYFHKCASSDYEIDMPQTQGAIHIVNCNGIAECYYTQADLTKRDSFTTTADVQEFWRRFIARNMPHNQVTVRQNYFYSNTANIVLNKSQTIPQAASLFIVGGRNNVIQQNRFTSHRGPFNPWVFNYAYDLYVYMPKNYFVYSQAPVMRIFYPEDQFISAGMNETNTFTSNEFRDNYNFQIYTFGLQSTYTGGLIEFDSHMPEVSFNFTNNVVTQNQIIGENCALISLTGGLAIINQNSFKFNGFLTNEQLQANPNDQQREFMYNYFPYETYTLQRAQDIGIFYFNFIWKDVPENKGHFITNNIFSYNFCVTGCAYAFGGTQIQQLSFANNVYDFQIASNYGAVSDASRLILPQSDEFSQIWIQTYTNETITDTYGSAISILNANNYPITIVENTKFSNNKGQNGGAISLTSGGAIFVANCTFTSDERTPWTKLDSDISDWMYEGNPPLYNSTIVIYDGLFSQKVFDNFKDTRPIKFLVSSDYLTSQVDDAVNTDGQICLRQSQVQIKHLTQPLISRGLPIDQYIMKAYQIDISASSTIINSVFENLEGGISSTISIYASTLNLLATGDPWASKNFIRNYSSIGSTIYASYSQLTTNSLYMHDNRANQGGCMMLDNSQLKSVNSVFESNKASQGGVFFAIQKSKFNVSNVTIAQNYADDSSVLYAMANNQPSSLKFDSSVIKNNLAELNLMHLLLSQVVVSNSIFDNNFSKLVNNGITMISSVLTVSNSLIETTRQIPVGFDVNKVDTGFFNLYLGSSLDLGYNTVIQNLMAQNCAVISALSQSSIVVHDGVFFNNNTAIIAQGAATVCLSNAKIATFDQAHFAQNYQTNIMVTLGQLSVRNSTFTQGSEHHISGSQSTVDLTQVRVFDSSSKSFDGHGFFCSYCNRVTIANSTFEDLTAYQGGAIYLEDLQQSNSYIYNSTFRNNQAMWKGGALLVDTPAQLDIMGNVFENNTVLMKPEETTIKSQDGGAIFYQCDPKMECSFNLAGNTFIANQANNKGGAILWVNQNVTAEKHPYQARRNLCSGSDCETQINVFDQNQAIYGQNIGNYPAQIKYSLTDYTQTGASIGEEGTDLNLAPGQAFGLTITIYDQDGNIYNDENKAIAAIDFVETSQLDKNSVVVGRQAVAKNGHFSFPYLTLRLKPDSQAQVKLSITDLEIYGNNVSFIQSPPVINVTARACVEGEYFDLFLSCLPCAPGFYSYVRQTEVGICEPCDIRAICYGRNITTVKDGYWRKNATSTNFLDCKNHDACLQGDETHPIGICSKGYQGILCADCEFGYRKSGFKCNQCPKLSSNLTLLIFLGIALLVFISLLVRSTLTSVQVQKPLYSVYYKIAMTHFQILASISSIDFAWPPTIQVVLNSQKSISDAPAQALSPDCIQQALYGNKQHFESGLRTINSSTIMYTLLPIGIFLASFLFWRIYGLFARLDKQDMSDKILATQVIVLFLFYPTIVGVLADSVNCINIEGQQRLFKDLEQVCWHGQHAIVFYCATIPGMVFWALGIPFYALYKLRANKLTLAKMRERTDSAEGGQFQELNKRFNIRLGFLKAGFEEDQYYWEVVLLMRKTIIVMMVTFLAPVSAGVQSLTAILVLAFFFWLQNRYKPYYAESLNRMEMISLGVLILTIYAGLYYQSGKNDAIMQSSAVMWIIFIMVLLPSTSFVIYFLYQMRIEVFKVLIKRSPKVFNFVTCGMVDINKFREQYMQEDVAEEKQPTEEEKESDREIDEPFNFKQLPDSSVTMVNGNLTEITGNDVTGFPDEKEAIDLEDIKYTLGVDTKMPKVIRDESDGGTPNPKIMHRDSIFLHNRDGSKSHRVIADGDYRDQVQFEGENVPRNKPFFQLKGKHPDDEILDDDPVSQFTARRRDQSPAPTSRSYSQISQYSKVHPVKNNFVVEQTNRIVTSSVEIQSTFQDDLKGAPMLVVKTDQNDTSSDAEGESSYKARKLIEEESGGSMQFEGTFAFKTKNKKADDDDVMTPQSSLNVNSDMHLSTDRLNDLDIQTRQSLRDGEQVRDLKLANIRAANERSNKQLQQRKKNQVYELSPDSSSDGDPKMHTQDLADMKHIRNLVGLGRNEESKKGASNSKQNQNIFSQRQSAQKPVSNRTGQRPTKANLMSRPQGKTSDYSMSSDSSLDLERDLSKGKYKADNRYNSKNRQQKPGPQRHKSEVPLLPSRGTTSSEGVDGGATVGTKDKKTSSQETKENQV